MLRPNNIHSLVYLACRLNRADVLVRKYSFFFFVLVSFVPFCRLELSKIVFCSNLLLMKS